MDWNGFWQENKGFVAGVALGAMAFAGGLFAIDRVWGSDLRLARRDRSGLVQALSAPLYDTEHEREAEDDHEQLVAARAALSRAVAFEARPAFRLDPASGTAGAQYHRAVAAVQDDLLPLANRSNVAIDRGLGLPALSPTRDDEIERYLEALDAIDRAARMAVAAGVARVDQIEIRLDPALYARSGVGRVERTKVKISLSGSGLALLRFLELTQDPSRSPSGAQALLLGEVDLAPARGKTEEVRLTAEIVLARLARPPEPESESGAAEDERG